MIQSATPQFIERISYPLPIGKTGCSAIGQNRQPWQCYPSPSDFCWSRLLRVHDPADVKAAERGAYKIERREFDLVSLRSLLIGPKAWTDAATSLALHLAEPRSSGSWA